MGQPAEVPWLGRRIEEVQGGLPDGGHGLGPVRFVFAPKVLGYSFPRLTAGGQGLQGFAAAAAGFQMLHQGSVLVLRQGAFQQPQQLGRRRTGLTKRHGTPPQEG